MRAVGHGRSVVQVRDVAIAGKPVRLVWRMRRWRCADPDCETRTLSEDQAGLSGVLTHRAGAEICRLVGQEGHSVASVARCFGAPGTARCKRSNKTLRLISVHWSMSVRTLLPRSGSSPWLRGKPLGRVEQVRGWSGVAVFDRWRSGHARCRFQPVFTPRSQPAYRVGRYRDSADAKLVSLSPS